VNGAVNERLVAARDVISDLLPLIQSLLGMDLDWCNFEPPRYN
jgi:hypothetical protein